MQPHGPREKVYTYLFSTYLLNLLAGLGCWVWFYILNDKVYDGKVCQLFAEGKEDLCSLSSLVHKTKHPDACLEKLKYGRSESITLVWLHLLHLLFVPPDSAPARLLGLPAWITLQLC